MWGAYNGLDRLLGHNYTHHTVNHSQHFVDPATGAHTQSVESMWSQCKRMMRNTQTMHSQLFHTYLPEFMWRKKFDSPHQNAFSNIIPTHIVSYLHKYIIKDITICIIIKETVNLRYNYIFVHACQVISLVFITCFLWFLGCCCFG